MQRGHSETLEVRQARIGWAVLCVLASPFMVFQLGDLRINATPSLPLGIYRVSNSDSATLVEFCPLEPWAALASARSYRARGNCPDGGSPMMKSILAREGDLVEFSPIGIRVNGRVLARSAPKTRDSSGRELRPWAYGAHRVQLGTVWVGSTFNEWSFDSRYFGPIPTTIVRNRLTPFLTL